MILMSQAEPQLHDDGSLPTEIRVYVNEHGVSVARGSSALEAVRALLGDQAENVMAGRARLTDSRGLPLAPDTVVHGGAIIRVLPVRERAAQDTP